MAIARCEGHPPKGIKHEYDAYAEPIGYPTTAAICGRINCEEPAYVWLTPEDVAQHKRGSRVFNVRTHSTKLKVIDKLVTRKGHELQPV
jgi:hypothetical protein